MSEPLQSTTSAVDLTPAAEGESPLVTAASTGRVDLVGKLLKAGVPADAETASGLTALAAAAMNGHLSCVTRLLQAGATADKPGGYAGATPLLHAARGGHRACVETLLDAGADSTIQDLYGESAQTAAERYETEARLQASDFAHWASLIHNKAAIINAEPPPPVPLFPLDPRKDLERWYRSTDPTKMLWRPGAWMHQKRPATGAVVQQQRPRAFSATGYAVDPVVIPREGGFPGGTSSMTGESVLAAERYADQAEVKALQGAESALLKARLARERTNLNPQVFHDDLPRTTAAARAAMVDASAALRSIDRQELKLGRKFPTVPTHLPGTHAPVYSSQLQRAAMSTPSAASSLYPMLESPGPDSLSALLRRPRRQPGADGDDADGELGAAQK